jgi:hypothetical protein
MNRLNLFIVVLLLSSCVGTKWTTNTSSQSASAVLKKAEVNTKDMRWFTTSIKGKADFDNRSLPITAQLRMRKDSVIWMSMSALMGIEAARVHITPDSVKLINRLNATYFVGGIESLSEEYNLPFSFYELQDLLLAAIHPKENSSYTLDVSPDVYTLFSSSGQSIIKLNTSYLPMEVFHSRSDSQFVKINYQNYLQTDSIWLPKTVKIDVQSSEKTAEATLNYSKTTVNRPKKVKFSIPSSYVPM